VVLIFLLTVISAFSISGSFLEMLFSFLYLEVVDEDIAPACTSDQARPLTKSGDRDHHLYMRPER